MILVAVVVLVGPQKLAESLGRSAGEITAEFEDVPKEFRSGVEEGEIEARSRSAKRMDEVGQGEGEGGDK